METKLISSHGGNCFSPTPQLCSASLSLSLFLVLSLDSQLPSVRCSFQPTDGHGGLWTLGPFLLRRRRWEEVSCLLVGRGRRRRRLYYYYFFGCRAGSGHLSAALVLARAGRHPASLGDGNFLLPVMLASPVPGGEAERKGKHKWLPIPLLVSKSCFDLGPSLTSSDGKVSEQTLGFVCCWGGVCVQGSGCI